MTSDERVEILRKEILESKALLIEQRVEKLIHVTPATSDIISSEELDSLMEAWQCNGEN